MLTSWLGNGLTVYLLTFRSRTFNQYISSSLIASHHRTLNFYFLFFWFWCPMYFIDPLKCYKRRGWQVVMKATNSSHQFPESTRLFLIPTWPIYINDLHISSALRLVEHTHRWVYTSDPRRFGFKPYRKGNCWYGEWLPRKKGKVRGSFLSLVTSETKTELSSYLVTKLQLFGADFAVLIKGIKCEYYSLCIRLRLYL